MVWGPCPSASGRGAGGDGLVLLGEHYREQRRLRRVRVASGLLGLFALPGNPFAVGAHLGKEGESVRGEAELVLRDRYGFTYVFHCDLVVKIAKLAQAHVVGSTHDNVVEHFDFHKLSGADQVACHFNVSLRRGCLTARVVVHDDDRCRAEHAGQAEHFTGMD